MTKTRINNLRDVPVQEGLNRYDYVCLSLMTIVLNFFWFQNAKLSIIDSSTLVTYINYYHQFADYPDSLVVAGFNNYLTYYFEIAAFLSRYLSVNGVVLLLSLVPGLVMVPAVFALGYTVFRNKYVGYLTVMMVLTQWQLVAALGGSEAYGDNLAHVSFVTPFLITSIVLFFRGHYRSAYLIAGLMINIHAPLALSAIFVLFLCSVRSTDLSLARTIMLLAISMMAGAPTIAWFASSLGSHSLHSAESHAEWLTLARLRSFHSMPDNWEIGKFIRFFAFSVNLFLLRELKNRMEVKIYRNVISVLLAISALCVIGYVFVEIYNISLITQLSLFRSTRFVVLISAIILAGYFVLMVRGGKSSIVEIVLSAFVVASLASGNVKPAIVFELLLFSRLCMTSSAIYYLPIVSVMVLSCIMGLFYTSRSHIYPLFDNLNLFVLLASVIGLGCFLMLCGRSVRARYVYGVMCLVFALYAVLGSFDAFSDEEKNYLAAEKEAQVWISENTPSDSKILIPPDMLIWESYSMRSNMLTYNDLAYAFYNLGLVPRVMEKLDAYGIALNTINSPADLKERMSSAYYGWDVEYVKSLAQRFNVSVLVVERAKHKTYDLPVVYENDYFQVYNLL